MTHSGVLAFSFLAVTGAACLHAQSGWAVIPLKEYDQLRARVAPLAAAPAEPEFDATLTRIEYDLRVNGDQAAGRATLTVDVLSDAWAQVPMPTGLYVREARLQPPGRAPLIVDGAAVFSKKGRSVLELDIAVPVQVAGGAERITLPAGGSGMVRASLTVDRAGIELTVAGGVLRPGPVANNWLAYGRGGDEPLVLSWRRKLEERRVELPLRQRGRLVESISLGEDSSVIWAEVVLDVTQGAARGVKLQLPEGITVNQVPGAMIADWELKGGGRQLEVTFLEPVEKQTTFLIQAEARLPREGAVDLPLFRLLDVERESGGVSVEVVGPAELKSAEPQGLERSDATELGSLPGPRPSGSVEVFRFLPGSPPQRALKVTVARYAPQAMLTALVEEARVQALASGDGKTLVRARYAIRNNQRNFLKLTLPGGAALWSASLEGRLVRPGQGPDSSLMLPLSKARAGDEAAPFALEVIYLVRGEAWIERGRASLPLPKLDMPVSRSGVMLFHPPHYRVAVEPGGSFRAGEFAPAESPALLNSATPQDPRAASAPVQAPNSNAASTNAAAVNSRMLVDRFRARRGARVPASAPLDIEFPSYGPSLFFTAQLTAESQEPRIGLTYRRERRRGDGGGEK